MAFGAAERIAVGSGALEHDVRTADIETAGEGYAGRFAGPVGAWFLDVQARAALSLLAGAEAGRLSVLEVGGGHGQLTRPLLDAGHRLVVHGSRPVCHARNALLGSRVGRVASDLWQLPFPDRSFDLVVGIRLLAHVESWHALLAEMARVSRRLLLVDFPVRSPLHSLAPALFGAKRKLEGNTRPYFDYSVAEIEQAVASLGMPTCGLRRQFALPMALHRGLGRAGLSERLESAVSALGITRRIGSPGLLLASRPSDEAGSPHSRGNGRIGR